MTILHYLPENLPDLELPRRGNKFSIVALPEKPKNEMFYHCAIHPYCRLIRMSDSSLRCPICGSPQIATRLVDTVEAE